MTPSCLPRAARIMALAVLLSTVSFCLAPLQSAAPVPQPVIPVALYDGPGASGKGPKKMEDALNAREFRVRRIKAEEVRAGKLQEFKVLIVPGGSGRSEGDALGEDGREMIRKFVAGGGTYVGVCAGCYLASCHYKWSLHILPVTVVDSSNWGRGRATLTLKLTPEGKEWLGRADAEVKTLYHNGPVLKEAPDAKEKLIPLATFGQEITRKGAKKGLMLNTPALAAARYGRGWAVGVSPHPEQTEGLEDVVPAAIRWTLKNPRANSR